MKNETNTCFNELFPDFIRKMEQTNTDILDPSITDAVTDICRAMGISYFHASIEISPELNKGVSITRQTTYFSEGEYDENLSYSIKELCVIPSLRNLPLLTMLCMRMSSTFP